MAQTATKKKAKTKAEVKAEAKELKRIANSCVGRRITVTNPYNTPSTWGGKITKCKVIGNSLWFDIRCDVEDGFSISARDTLTGISGKVTKRPDGSMTIVGEISRVTIAPPAK